MFARTGAAWAQEGAKLTGRNDTRPAAFGLTAALSSEGNTALIGGLAANGGAGAAWVFAPPGPTVTHIQPDEGPLAGGTEVTITGTNFTNSSTVSFGSTEASVVHVESATQITATAPLEGPGTVDVTVSNPGRVTATGPADHFTYDPVPAVTALEPDEGPLGGATQVTLMGSGFTSASTVDFGAHRSHRRQIRITDPLDRHRPAGQRRRACDGDERRGHEPRPKKSDLFFYDPIPPLSKIEPGEGPEAGGTSVTVTGTGFTAASTVSFGSTTSPSVKFISSTQLTARAPAGSGEVDVTVSTAGGTSTKSAADQFIYQPLPWIGTVEPGEGPAAGGTTVTITGEHFTPASKVSFGSSPATGVKVNSAGSITANSPAGGGHVYVTVSTAGGTSPKREGAEFTYIPPTMLLSEGGTLGGNGAGTGVLPFFTVVLPPPTLGVNGNIAPVSGLVRVRLPGTNTGCCSARCARCRSAPSSTPPTARERYDGRAHGKTQTGQFYDGEFVLTQGAKGTVVATLTGGNYSACPTAPRSAATRARQLDTLLGQARGEQTLGQRARQLLDEGELRGRRGAGHPMADRGSLRRHPDQGHARQGQGHQPDQPPHGRGDDRAQLPRQDRVSLAAGPVRAISCSR